jgi:glycosyltransferase involved in cell wall biosynthesis
MTLSIPAAIARACRGAKVLLDIQDLWPESVAESGMTNRRFVREGARALCSWAYRRTDRFLVLSEGYRAALTQRGVPADRIHVVYNWCDEAQVPRVSRPLGDQFGGEAVSILYAGNVGTIQALDVVLDAAKLLSGRGVGAKFIVAGSGVELDRLRSRQKTEAISNVDFIGRVEPQVMRAMYEATDAILIHLRDGPLTRIGIPQKVQMALAAGKPILLGVQGEARGLVEQAGAGLFFEPESVQGLAEVVENFTAMPMAARSAIGDRGRRYYFERMSFAQGSSAMLSVYSSMHGPDRSGGSKHRVLVPGLPG